MKKNLPAKSLPSNLTLCILLLLLLASKGTFAQLTGAISIPSPNYPTIKVAVDSLNTYGVGPGGVIFNVMATATETAPVGGIRLAVSGSASQPIIIRKDPATPGSNPVISAPAGTTTNLDGVFFLLGSDYVTIDGIDIQESASNTTATTQMEFGFALLNRNATAPFDGCQNNTIRNCSITLNKANTASRGIYANHHIVSATTSLILTAPADAHSFNKFYSSKIQNCFTGIFMNGYDDPIAPYALKDRGNDIGGSSFATADTITNFGTTGAFGIYMYNQGSATISYNYVDNALNGGSGATAAITGIFLNSTIGLYQDFSATTNVSFNTVNLTVASGSGSIYCIDIENTDGNLNVLNNDIKWSTAATTTGVAMGILVNNGNNNPGAGVFNFKNNTAQNFSFSTSTAICQIFSIAFATQKIQDVSGNVLNNITRNAATTGATYLLRYYNTPGALASGSVSNVYNNTITNITFNYTGTASTFALWASGNYTTNVYNNTINTINAPTGVVSFFGITSDNASLLNIYNNTVSAVNAGANMYGILSQILTGLVGQNIYGNTVTDLRSSLTGAYVVYGMASLYGGFSYNNVYRNKIAGLSQLGTGTSSVQGIYIAQGNSAGTLAPYTIHTNVLANYKALNSTVTANPCIIGINFFNQSFPYIATATYNTILLNDSGSANANSACIFMNVGRDIRLNNNVLINKTYHNPVGTGVASVIHRTGLNIANYNLASNNNVMFAGAGTARNLIHFDGINRDSSMLSFKLRVAPREAASMSSNIPMYDIFSAVPVGVTAPNYAQQDTTVASVVESSGQNIAGISADFRGVIRQGNTGYAGTGTRPDVGAFESQVIPIGFVFDSVMVVKDNTSALVNAPNQPVVNIQVFVSGGTGALAATQMNLSTTGTTNVADISKAKVFYTGSSSTFSAVNQFGSDINSPSGTFTVTGSQSLLPGMNNFWLAYDIAPAAVVGRVVDGVVNTVTVSGNTKTPLNGNPVGTKTIRSPLSGVYTIGTGAYTTLAAIVADLNGNGISSTVTVNVPAGFTETAPVGGYVLGSAILNASLSSSKTLTFRKSGAGVNPLLTANVGTSTTLDGIFTLLGTDYVTIDGIDLVDPVSNTTAAAQMEWGFGLLKRNALAPFDGCQYNVVRNTNITLQRINTASRGIYVNNHTLTDATQLIMTSVSDANSYNRFTSNTIQNVNTGIFINGFAFSASVVNVNLYDINNVVGDSATTGNQILNFGGAASGFGINLINQMNPVIGFNYVDNYNGGANGAVGSTLLATGIQNTYTMTTAAANPTNLKIFNNRIVITTAAAATGGIVNMNIIASHGDVAIENNNIKWATLGTGITSGALIGIYYNFSGGGSFLANSLSFKGNVARDFTFTAGGSTSHTVFYLNGAALTEDISYDTVTNVTRLAATSAFSATFTLLFATSSSNPGLTSMAEIVRNIHHNYFVAVNNGSTSTGGLTGMNLAGSYTINVYENTISSISQLGSASGLNIGIFCNATTMYFNVYNNRIDSIMSTSGPSVGISFANNNGLGANVYRNTISNLSSGGTGVQYAAGLFASSAGRNFRFYSNKIYALSTTTTGAGYAVGMYYNNVGLSAFNYTAAKFYNNIVGNITASTATSSTFPAVMGIGIAVSSASTWPNAELYHNTISLSGTTASNINSAGIYVGNLNPTVTIANNIVVNNITPSGTGVASAFHRVGTAIANIDNSTNNNVYWAGTPSANNVIYFDGTNKDQTMSAYQSRMYPREAVSVRENVAFISALGSSPYYLYPDTTIASAISNSGKFVSGYTTDFNAVLRSTSTPDIGAYEGNYTTADIIAPSITMTALSNVGSTTAPLTFSAVIKDPSGVPLSASGLEPRVYVKKTGGAYAAVSGTLASGNAVNGGWNFTINPTSMGGWILGDTISYYVVAQDALGNLGSAPAGVLGTSVTNITTDPPAVRVIVTTGLSGSYTVCATGCDFSSLTNAFGAFDSINKSALVGNVQLLIAGDLTAETGTIALNPLSANANNKITIGPNSATERLIVSNSTSLINFNGADNVTIDGRFAGTGKYLRFRNRSTGGSTIRFGNDAHLDTVRYVILEGNTQAVGTVYFTAPAAGGTGNDSNAVMYCDVTDTTGNGLNTSLTVNAVQNTGFYSDGNFNSENTIAFNNVYNFIYQGVNIAANLSGNDNWVINQNAFYQLPAAAAKAGSVGSVSTQAIRISSGQGHVITNNSIGGSAPDRSGAAWKAGFLSFGGISFRGIELQTNLGIDRMCTISGNTISNIDANPFGGTNMFAGIVVSSGWVNVTGNIVGGGAMPYDTIKEGSYSTTNVGGIVLAGGNVTVSNNVVGNLYNYNSNVINTNIRTVGINIPGGGSNPQIFTVSNNTIRDIRSNYMNPPTNMITYQASGPVGIYVTASVGTLSNIESNTIYNITNTNTDGFLGQAQGIGIRGGTNIIQRNRIYGLSAAAVATGTDAPSLIGIYIQNTSAMGQIVRNNQISLAAASGNTQLMGIVDGSNATPAVNNLYNNSIYIGGTNTGSANSYAIIMGSGVAAVSTKMYNNILYNGRNGGTGSHFAVSSFYLPDGINPGTFGYNLLVSSSAAAVMEMPAGNSMNALAINNMYSTQSSNSNWIETAANVSAPSLFTNTSLGNLSLVASNPACWYANGKGLPVSSVSNDFANVTRSTNIVTGASDIGSMEVTPSVAPSSAVASAAPALNTTTTYTYGNRIVASVNWGAAGTVPTALDIKYYTGTNAPSLLASRTQYNSYYSVIPTGGAGYTYSIALSYDSAVTGNVGSTAETRMAYYRTANANWSFVNSSSANVTSGMLSSGSSLPATSLPANFTGTNISNPLPVSLVKFMAKAIDGDVQIAWTTATEINNKGFEVQRSVDGELFEYVGFVRGAGNSSKMLSYSLIDRAAFATVASNTVYYRLKQVDMDGNSGYSDIVSVSEADQANLNISVYPNPASDMFTVSGTAQTAGQMSVIILNIQGKVVATCTKAVTEGVNVLSIDGSTLSGTGVYFVKVIINGEIKVMKLVKQ